MAYKTNPTDRARASRYYERNRESILARMRTRRSGPDAAAVRDEQRIRSRKWRGLHLDTARERARVSATKRRHAVRREMLEAFGSRCACCGETATAFLTLDHIAGGGKRHLLALGHTKMMLSIKREGWPKDKYRLLCMNCNFATRGGRTCPHTTAQVEKMLIEAFCS